MVCVKVKGTLGASELSHSFCLLIHVLSYKRNLHGKESTANQSPYSCCNNLSICSILKPQSHEVVGGNFCKVLECVWFVVE